MSIEIDVLNGDASWSRAEPLMRAVWPRHVVERLPWGHIEWAHADLRVLIDAPEDSPEGGLACHVGIYFRDAIWDGRKFDRRLGGVFDAPGLPGARLRHAGAERCYQDLRDHEAISLQCCSCEPHNERSMKPAAGTLQGRGLYEQPQGRIRFEAMARSARFYPQPRDESSTYAACRGDPCPGRVACAGSADNMSSIFIHWMT